MNGPGAPESTHFLLEGAIALAGRRYRQHEPARRERPSPRLDRDRWAYRLAGYFHTTHATRRLLPGIARRLASRGRDSVARWADQKVAEETGHDELALRDLTELGFRARELVQAIVPPRAAAWVALFERLASEPDPITVVGYAHALERLALLRGPAEVAAIERSLPRGLFATRCLRTHSAVGSDARHVAANVQVTAGLCPEDRRTIVLMCHQAAGIYFDPALDDRLSPSELEAAVAPFRAVLNSTIGEQTSG